VCVKTAKDQRDVSVGGFGQMYRRSVVKDRNVGNDRGRRSVNAGAIQSSRGTGLGVDSVMKRVL